MNNSISKAENCLIGIISDTHGILLPSVAKHFKDVDLIIHAGDIDRPDIIDDLETIAPVLAVRGNMDGGEWAYRLNEIETIVVANKRLCVVHDLTKLYKESMEEGIQVIISGHSHRPFSGLKHGILYVNPGSAGYPRDNTSHSIALLHIQQDALNAELIDLET